VKSVLKARDYKQILAAAARFDPTHADFMRIETPGTREVCNPHGGVEHETFYPLVQPETPRLWRGGIRSLTVPGVGERESPS
jgi:hypothetical protein